jgi:hypothetical protein
MSISIYKPNSKNSGSGFSFQIGISKVQEPAMFAKSILQSNWDSKKKQGSFKENLDNPDKNITVKFSEYEVGHIIHAMRTRCTYTTYHSYESDRTNIKFMPWEKKAKKSIKNEDGEWVDQWVQVPAFSVSFTRNGNQNFVIGLEPGETETVVEFLKFFLKTLFSHRFDKQIMEIKKAKERNKDA